MANCAKCGAALLDGASFCGSCGNPVAAAATPPPQTGATSTAGSSGLTSNVAGALAYVTIIPAIIFLAVEPYNKDRFVKFHSFQSLFFNIGLFVLMIAMMIVSFIIGMIPVVGGIVALLLWLVICLGSFVLWLLVMYKAYNNEKYMLPVIGNLAEQQAAK